LGGQVRRHHVDVVGQILPVSEGEESRPVLLNEVFMPNGSWFLLPRPTCRPG
jgi:hypothetical protein